jgi:hypothetical protein
MINYPIGKNIQDNLMKQNKVDILAEIYLKSIRLL